MQYVIFIHIQLCVIGEFFFCNQPMKPIFEPQFLSLVIVHITYHSYGFWEDRNNHDQKKSPSGRLHFAGFYWSKEYFMTWYELYDILSLTQKDIFQFKTLFYNIFMSPQIRTIFHISFQYFEFVPLQKLSAIN